MKGFVFSQNTLQPLPFEFLQHPSYGEGRYYLILQVLKWRFGEAWLAHKSTKELQSTDTQEMSWRRY